jgi:hypothetical protein
MTIGLDSKPGDIFQIVFHSIFQVPSGWRVMRLGPRYNKAPTIKVCAFTQVVVVITGANADKTAIISAGNGGPFHVVGLISYDKPILPPLSPIFYVLVMECLIIDRFIPS